MPKAKDERFRRFRTEPEAANFLLESLSVHFQFWEQVGATDRYSGGQFRLDALGVCRTHGYVLGWEFKKSHLFKSEFAQALKQAADYRGALLKDDKIPAELNGRHLDACIVFPDWDGLHDAGEVVYASEAEGMRLLASHFRVGTLKQDVSKGVFHLVIGEQAIWHSNTGWTGNADGVLRGKRRKGSGKTFD